MARVFKPSKPASGDILEQQGHTSKQHQHLRTKCSSTRVYGKRSRSDQSLHKKLGLGDEVSQWIKILATNADCLSLAPGTQLVRQVNRLLQIVFRSLHVGHAMPMVPIPNTP